VPVEGLGKPALHEPHAQPQRQLAGPHHQVVVVGHQAPGEDREPMLGLHPRQRLEEQMCCLLVRERPLAPAHPAVHVIGTSDHDTLGLRGMTPLHNARASNSLTRPLSSRTLFGVRKAIPSHLSTLSKALGVSIGALVESEARPVKRGQTPKLQRQIELLQGLTRSKQCFVSEMLDTTLQQAG
jgi:hypothetical protein